LPRAVPTPIPVVSLSFVYCRVPNPQVPQVYVAVVVVAALFLRTWKVPAFAAGMYYLSRYSANNPAQRPGDNQAMNM